MEVVHDPILPCGIICTFEVKKYGNNMFLLNKSFANKSFEANQVIESASLFTKAALNGSNKFVFSLKTKEGGR